MEVAYPKAEEDLIDFLNRCKISNTNPMLCPRCNAVFDSDLKSHNVILTNYEGTTGNSLGVVEVDLIVGSISRTTMFMVVPSKANFNVLLGIEWIHGVEAVPYTLHQRISIWRKDGLVENIEADQSYFLAEVNNITKKNFDKQLAYISPVMSLGPKYTIS